MTAGDLSGANLGRTQQQQTTKITSKNRKKDEKMNAKTNLRTFKTVSYFFALCVAATGCDVDPGQHVDAADPFSSVDPVDLGQELDQSNSQEFEQRSAHLVPDVHTPDENDNESANGEGSEDVPGSEPEPPVDPINIEGLIFGEEAQEAGVLDGESPAEHEDSDASQTQVGYSGGGYRRKRLVCQASSIWGLGGAFRTLIAKQRARDNWYIKCAIAFGPEWCKVAGTTRYQLKRKRFRFKWWHFVAKPCRYI